MIALYADEVTPEGKEAIDALVNVEHAHITTSGGKPYAVWDRLAFKGVKQIRALGDSLRLGAAIRAWSDKVLRTGDTEWQRTPIS